MAFLRDTKEAQRVDLYFCSFCTHILNILWSKLLVLLKKKNLDLPNSSQQTHIYNGGRAGEDWLRVDFSGHSVSYYTMPVPQIVMGEKFLQSYIVEFQICRKTCVQI